MRAVPTCRHGELASMGSVADCFDDALAECVLATLECELFDPQPGARVRLEEIARQMARGIILITRTAAGCAEQHGEMPA
ncbi:MAG TPA: hypothetical protein VN520_34550 [Streptomyces sp.]|uniref:hypothetical protein n=1 Tax=Streptomyces sp. TaxID=1931 RepID=UPI002C6C3941|nr:hypothetical protein [Streptomyces sp.]HWU11422.1 hypothetical protein [Streptomyces sp.]